VVEFGETLIELPVPTGLFPQLLAYQFQLALVPKAPPATLRVEELPGHTVAGEAVAESGTVDSVLTLTMVLAQLVILQLLSART